VKLKINIKCLMVTSTEEIGMRKAMRAIALNILRKNMDLETMGEVTRLTIAQLEKLQAEAKSGKASRRSLN
jgi:hypothetical protein